VGQPSHSIEGYGKCYRGGGKSIYAYETHISRITSGCGVCHYFFKSSKKKLLTVTKHDILQFLTSVTVARSFLLYVFFWEIPRRQIQTPGNYPEGSIQHSEDGASLKSIIFCVFTRLRKISKPDYWIRHFCLSVNMEQLGTH